MHRITLATAAMLALSGCKLTVTPSDNGIISSTTGSIYCGTDCSETYKSTTTETLIPAPNPGYLFQNWTGECAEQHCEVTMTPRGKGKKVGAEFSSTTANLEAAPVVWRVENVASPFSGIDELRTDEFGKTFATLAKTTESITIQFSKQIRSELINPNSIVIWDQIGSYVVDYVSAISPDQKSLIITFATPYTEEHLLEVNLNTSRIQDMDGNTLTEASSLLDLVATPDLPAGMGGNLVNDISYDALSSASATFLRLNIAVGNPSPE